MPQLEDQVAHQTSALEERARQLEALYLVSAAANRVGPGENFGLDPAAHR